jgi:hypothetical protein
MAGALRGLVARLQRPVIIDAFDQLQNRQPRKLLYRMLRRRDISETIISFFREPIEPQSDCTLLSRFLDTRRMNGRTAVITFSCLVTSRRNFAIARPNCERNYRTGAPSDQRIALNPEELFHLGTAC